MSNFIKNIQNTVFQNSLFKKNDKIILAVSGGPDSVCMLDVFSELQKKYNLELIIAHVNYGLRGADSKKDEELVRKLARKYGMEIFTLKPHPALRATLSLVKERGIMKFPSEDYLRKIRYDFFEKVRSENNFDAIAVAHNLDDQVETFLMRVIRGTGTDGLTAMKFRNGFLIRPLLATTRKEILAYLKEKKLSFRIDKTNLENLYSRNKIRNELIPILQKKFNPQIQETIFSSLVSIAEDSDFLEKETQKSFSKNSSLEISKLKKLHPAILRRLLRKKIEEKNGSLKNISTKNIEEILKVINSTKSKTQIIKFENLKITRRGDKLEIS